MNGNGVPKKQIAMRNFPLCWCRALLDDLVETLPPANQHTAMEKRHQHYPPKVSHESPEYGTKRNRR